MTRDYSKWIAGAREAGLSQDEITAQLENWMAEDLALLKGQCPKCGAAVRKSFDQSKRGAPDDDPGVFVLYRCSRDAEIGVLGPRPCGYNLDRWETGESLS